MTLLLLVIPHFAFWITVLLSTEINHLYFARVCAGLTGGGVLRTVSLYIAEISENHIRGRLGSLLMLFLSAGLLTMFIAGTYLSFFTAPLVLMIFPTMFFISVLFLPDTPPSLMARNLPEAAFKSLMFYRTCGRNRIASAEIISEFELLKKASENRDYDDVELKDFCELNAMSVMLEINDLLFHSDKTSDQSSDFWIIFNVSEPIFWINGHHDLHSRHLQ